jgi:hypothetical protein
MLILEHVSNPPIDSTCRIEHLDFFNGSRQLTYREALVDGEERFLGGYDFAKLGKAG